MHSIQQDAHARLRDVALRTQVFLTPAPWLLRLNPRPCNFSNPAARQARPLLEALNKLNAKDFAGQLHTRFKVQVDNSSLVELELAEVNERPTSPKIELFSLIFRGPVTPRLAQRIHPLEHDALGKLEIFLTPIGLGESGTLYEAVFHRFTKPQP